MWKLLPLIFLFLSSCKKQEPAHQEIATPVSVFLIKAADVPAEFQAVGTIESSHLVDIRARVEGYLDTISYIEGSPVKAGQILFQIDPRPFQAKLDSAQAELAKQKAILWNATTTRNRLEPLYKEHAISERDLDNAIAEELAAQASVEAATANVHSAELNLGYTTVSSPIDGITSAANYREGSLIQSAQPQPLTTVSAINPIWINFSVSENTLLEHQKAVEAGLVKDPSNKEFTVQIKLSDGSTYPYTGVVDFLEPFYDQNTGTLNVRTTFPNPKELLKPNQFVDVHVLGATYISAHIVPQSAILQGGKGPFVYIVGSDNRAEMTLVETGSWWNNYWVIKTGLKDGDKVVVGGVSKIRQGSLLKVTEELPGP